MAPASLRVRALQWLAQREHSRTELRAKLLRLTATRGRRAGAGAGPATAATADPVSAPAPVASPAEPADAQATARAVDELLDWLASHGYLSDARFLESRIHARQGRYGNLRIRQELRQHGLALDGPAHESLLGSELDRAQALWQRKYGKGAADVAGQIKQMRFLAGRGFSADVVRRVVRGAASSSADPGDEVQAGDFCLPDDLEQRLDSDDDIARPGPQGRG